MSWELSFFHLGWTGPHADKHRAKAVSKIVGFMVSISCGIAVPNKSALTGHECLTLRGDAIWSHKRHVHHIDPVPAHEERVA